MLARRIIPCLDVKDGWVVKGVRFQGHEPMGSAVALASAYARAGADELVFYDIAASPEGRTLDFAWVAEIASELDIPFTVAGGIRSVAQAVACLEAGADKVSVNSPALARPALIDEMARVCGTQCVVVGIDSRDDGAGDWTVHAMTGDPDKARAAGRRTLDWAEEAQARGAGEIVLNCMDQDGVRAGYDLAQLKAVRDRLSVPLVASGGAGAAEHFRDAFAQAGVSGALAASVFHKGVLTIPDLKRRLAGWGVEVRP
jgi:cyclase